MIDYLIETIPKLVLLANMISAFLPKPGGRGVLSKLHSAINIMAFNFYHATNRS